MRTQKFVNNMDITELFLLKKEIELKIESEISLISSAFSDEFKSRIKEKGLTLQDILPRSHPHANKGKKIPPVYFGSNGQSWTGRGKRPRWIIEFIEQGGDINNLKSQKHGD